MTKKTKYLFFCLYCGHPLEIPKNIIKQYFTMKGFNGCYCGNCYEKIKVPKYLKKIADDL